MKNLNIVKAFLLISGLIGVGVGSGLLFTPVAFEASAGIFIKQDPSLLSEIRGSGGVILASGLLIIAGVFLERLQFLALSLTSLIYLAYGLSRMFSMAMDGMPSQTIVMVAILEVIFGLISIVLLSRKKEFLGYT